jgi:hypothetical protein
MKQKIRLMKAKEAITEGEIRLMKVKEAIMEGEEARCSLGIFRQKWIHLCDNTDTSAHSAPNSHKAVNREESTVDWATQEIPEKVWSTRVFVHEPEKDDIRIQSETAVVNHLTQILEAVIHGLGLSSVLEVLVQRMVAGIECDIIVVYGSNLISIGAIEVKKPHGEKDDKLILAERNNKVAGQNLNHDNDGIEEVLWNDNHW